MLPLFKTFLFNKFPQYFKDKDSYKDTNDKGLLERYLEIFGEELDDNVSDDIDNYLDVVDSLITDEKFLTLIAYSLGNPPDIFNDPSQYRKILANILAVYKIKGTRRSYEIFFEMLGFEVLTLTEYPQVWSLYDTGQLYDETNLTYDKYCCTCSFYDIAFGTLTNNPIDQTTLDILKQIIFFVEPINAVLQNLIFALTFRESVDYCGQEDVNITSKKFTLYDDSLIYDNSEIYDNGSTLSITNIVTQCSSPLEGIDYWIIGNDFIIQ